MRSEPVALASAMDVTSTGDIWLFRGRKANDRFVRAATNSPVNHVAMAVALDDLPPLLWHTESTPSAIDVWSGDWHSGVQLQRLDQAVETWTTRWGHRPFVPHISPAIERPVEVMYLTAIEHRKNRSNPTAQIMGWHQILNQLAVLHPNRITID